ncbi:MAG: PTS sugar transporter subunit IIA [Candidatus Aminicenantales bacterium]
MKICGLLREDHIFLDLEPGGKKHILEEFVSALKKRGLISREKVILEELLKRESLGSTGLEKGIALPHALIDKIEEPLLALAVFKKGVDFEAADQRPTHVILLLLGKKDEPGYQLKLLAHICRLVKETDVVEKIRKAKSARDICVIFEREEGKI